MEDLISRHAVLDALNNIEIPRNASWYQYYQHALTAVDKLPSAEPYTINSDGRLWITVDDIDKVTAVVVDEHKSKFCKQFYEDAEPERGK